MAPCKRIVITKRINFSSIHDIYIKGTQKLSTYNDLSRDLKLNTLLQLLHAIIKNVYKILCHVKTGNRIDVVR